MTTCEHCQAKLLHHLYGLLDEDDDRDLRSHLSGCPACRAALARADEQKTILAEAAKSQFPEVRFTAPAMVTPRPSGEPTQVLRRPRKAVPWALWALAASVLLMVVGGIAAFMGVQQRAAGVAQAEGLLAQLNAKAQQSQAQILAERDRLDKEIGRVQDEIRKLTEAWDKETANVQRIISNKQVQVIITGPKNLQAGARNTYQIEMHRRDAGAKKPGMLAQVVNPQTKEVLFERQLANQDRVDIDLPPNLPVRPGATLDLIVKADGDKDAPMQISEALPLLASMYMTHLATDRPMYRPGETVHFRSMTLQRFNLKPADEDFVLQYRITGPSGAEVYKVEKAAKVILGEGQEPLKGPDGKVIHGIGAGDFQLPEELSGGEYTLHVAEVANRFPTETRKFIVNRYQAPRLNKELEFSRKSYGAGEEVRASCKVARAEGGAVISGQPVIATLRVDGNEQRQDLQTTNGKVEVKFKLPENIDRGEASLSVQFFDGGNTETIVRPVPVVLKKLFVDFYPEGGDLVAGVPNRVYFQVHTTIGKPADLRGKIIDEDGNVITKVETLSDDDEAGVNQGMGVFTITPVAGKKYELKIASPIGIDSKHVLPEARAEGVALTIPDGVVEDKIALELHNGQKNRNLMVGAYCRGRLLDSSTDIALNKGETKAFTLNTVPGVSGVYRVTVFDVTNKQPVPLAERLIYRRPVEKVSFKIHSDREVYTPGERVKVTIDAANERKQMTPAIVMASVIDLSLLKLVDEKTARALPTHFYMTTEVKNPEDLEYADFLVSAHPKADAALDLLLGTQGWRRFAEQDPNQFRQAHPAEANRLLTASGQGLQRRVELDQLAMERIDKDFAPKLIALQKAAVARNEEQQHNLAEIQNQQNMVNVQVHETQHNIQQARADLHRYTEMLPVVGGLGLAALAFVLGIGAIIVGVVRVARNGPNGLGYIVGGACMMVLLVVGGSGAALTLLLFEPPAKTVAQVAMDAEAMPKEAMAVEKEDLRAGGGGFGGLGVPMPGNEARFKDVEVMKKDFFDAPRMPPKMVPPPVAKHLMPMQAPMPVLAPNGPVGGPPMPNAPLGQPGPAAPPAEAAAQVAGEPMQPMFGRPPRLPDEHGRIGLLADLQMDDRFALLHQDQRVARLNEDLKQALLPIMIEPFAVRIYAHQHQTSSPDGIRDDFTETLYWHPVLVLPDGHGEFSFDLSDSVTRFQVLVAGHALDGRLGSDTFEFASRLPFSIEPKVPFEVTNTDKIAIPVTIANDTNKTRNVKLDIHADGLTALGESVRELSIGPEKRVRQVLRFQPSQVNVAATLRIAGDFGPFAKDTVERGFKVVPEGFPAVISRSDMLEGTAIEQITLPPSWVEGTLECKVQVFPSTLADLQKGLEGLLNEPGGCFEQASSNNYPNILILNYLQQSDQANPEVEKRARAMLKNGYALLNSYECMKPEDQKVRRGYEWFGQTAPPHEALTAYGLLEFRDMAKVFPVDDKMVERTRQYLLGQRDGKGGFKRNPQALDSFGAAPDHITNAYIVWALTEGGEKTDLTPELDALGKQAKTSKDPYFLALVGISMLNANRTQEGVDILKALKDSQKADGHLDGATTSITRSGGRDLEIETTALATLGWLKANRPGDFQTAIQKAVAWIGKQRGGYGGFGSTQSTILALKTLITHAHANRKTAEAGTLQLYIDGQKEAVDKIDFPANSLEPLIVSVPQDKLNLLKPGKNKLRVEMTGKNAFPYTLSLTYRTRQPANADNCPVHLSARLDRNQANEGETVRVKATVENKSGKGQGMVVAILGIPAGMSLPENLAQLKDMARLQENGTKPGKIAYFEVRGRELVLYWRDMGPEQKYDVDIDLICRIPGEYRGPASRAYLYYNADDKFWTEPLAMTINAKE